MSHRLSQAEGVTQAGKISSVGSLHGERRKITSAALTFEHFPLTHARTHVRMHTRTHAGFFFLHSLASKSYADPLLIFFSFLIEGLTSLSDLMEFPLRHER